MLSKEDVAEAIPFRALGRLFGGRRERQPVLSRLKAALASSRDQTAEIRAERDRLLTREHLRAQRRWYRRLIGG